MNTFEKIMASTMAVVCAVQLVVMSVALFKIERYTTTENVVDHSKCVVGYKNQPFTYTVMLNTGKIMVPHVMTGVSKIPIYMHTNCVTNQEEHSHFRIRRR